MAGFRRPTELAVNDVEDRFTFAPTHGSWLNLVEGFFSKFARSVLRQIRGSHYGRYGLLQSRTHRSHLVLQARPRQVI